jgi:hypothetical protein
MESFLEILRQPDNIAVIFLLIAAATVSFVAFGEARKNDRLIRTGAKDQLVERMDR